MTYSCSDFTDGIFEVLKIAGLARFDLADEEEESEDDVRIRAFTAVSGALDDRRHLLAALQEALKLPDVAVSMARAGTLHAAQAVVARAKVKQHHTTAQPNAALLEAAAHGKALSDQS